MNDWYAATCEKLKLLDDLLKREVLSNALDEDKWTASETAPPHQHTLSHRERGGREFNIFLYN